MKLVTTTIRIQLLFYWILHDMGRGGATAKLGGQWHLQIIKKKKKKKNSFILCIVIKNFKYLASKIEAPPPKKKSNDAFKK